MHSGSETGLRVADLMADNGPLSVVDVRTNRVPTGFDPLDTVLGGGFAPSDLVVLGGRPGVGKTVALMQWARSAAIAGFTPVIVSYEHDELTMMGRLLAMELGMLGTELGPEHRAGQTIAELARSALTGADASMMRHPMVQAARERIAAYADRLVFVAGSTRRDDLGRLEKLLDHHSDASVLVVDYVQKVPVLGGAGWEMSDEHRTRVVSEGLKQLALDREVTVIAAASATGRGLEEQRVHLSSLRGAQSLGYESDVVLTLNAKLSVVSRNHIAYDPTGAEDFKRFVVLSIEKNRSGPDDIDLEFEKAFAEYRFRPRGRFVTERLIDGRDVVV